MVGMPSQLGLNLQRCRLFQTGLVEEGCGSLLGKLPLQPRRMKLSQNIILFIKQLLMRDVGSRVPC